MKALLYILMLQHQKAEFQRIMLTLLSECITDLQGRMNELEGNLNAIYGIKM